ncbi:MAG: hypothetical protein K5860_06615 [Bacteroidales bacterium]|nr:hypothetical protein [Bacteroidales bacterium]
MAKNVKKIEEQSAETVEEQVVETAEEKAVETSEEKAVETSEEKIVETAEEKTPEGKEEMKVLNITQLKKLKDEGKKIELLQIQLCTGLDEYGNQKHETVFRAIVDREMFEIKYGTFKKYQEL